MRKKDAMKSKRGERKRDARGGGWKKKLRMRDITGREGEVESLESEGRE